MNATWTILYIMFSQGQPSGEAFIQMDSEASAFGASNIKHHLYMVFGKKKRYIEVFQCSGEDMNVVLTGNAGGASGGKPQQPPLLSPGMLPIPTSVHQPGYDMLGLAQAGLGPQLLPGLGLGLAQPQLQLLGLPQGVPGLAGLGLGLPPTAPPLLMLPPRPGLGFPPALGYTGARPLLATPLQHQLPPVSGHKRSHEQAFAAGGGGYTGSLPPKRPPVMYTSAPGTPPATPALLPTPTTMYHGAQGAAAGYPGV